MESTQREDHYRISPTAKLVAYERAKSDIPYAQDISRAIGAQTVTKNMLGEEADIVSYFLAPMVESRYKAIDRKLAEASRKNILELAAGVLPRGLIMTQDPSVRYVATDLPEMIRESETVMRGIMAQSGMLRSNLYFKAANVLDLEQLTEAIKPFNGEPFTVSCEGLWMYLNPQEKRKGADNLYELTSKHNGIWVTTDTFDTENRGRLMVPLGLKFLGMLKTVLQKLQEETGSKAEDFFFESQAHAVKFFNDSRFNVELSPFFHADIPTTFAAVPETFDNVHDFRDKMQYCLSQRKVFVMTPR